MQQYRQHVIPTRTDRGLVWWASLAAALAVTSILITLYGVAERWDAESDARVVSDAQLREQIRAEAEEALKPTILGAYRAGLADGAARAGRSCKRGDL